MPDQDPKTTSDPCKIPADCPAITLGERMGVLDGEIRSHMKAVDERLERCESVDQSCMRKMERMEEAQDTVLREVVTIRTTVDQTAQCVDKVYKSLFEGNGHESVMTRLTVLEEDKANRWQDSSMSIRLKHGIIITLISVLSAGIVSAAVALLK